MIGWFGSEVGVYGEEEPEAAEEIAGEDIAGEVNAQIDPACAHKEEEERGTRQEQYSLPSAREAEEEEEGEKSIEGGGVGRVAAREGEGLLCDEAAFRARSLEREFHNRGGKGASNDGDEKWEKRSSIEKEKRHPGNDASGRKDLRPAQEGESREKRGECFLAPGEDEMLDEEIRGAQCTGREDNESAKRSKTRGKCRQEHSNPYCSRGRHGV